jgi:hypothetical protein
MKIRMLTGISGLDFNVVPKEETDRFSDGEAVRLMLSDQAEPVDEQSVAALTAARDVGLPPVEAESEDPPAEDPPAEDPPAEDHPVVADELDDIANTMKLKSIAKGEDVDLGDARSAVDIRAAIRAARAAKAG